MARLPRFDIPDFTQHVIQRGNNREPVFVQDADYQFYLEKSGDACRRYGCELHAYVLMTNHTHLLVSPREQGATGKVMQSLGRYYVQYFNHCYQRTGTLWEGRYKATLIDDEQYLLTCMRYIELNPVRANMVLHPKSYTWSSYHANALGKENPLLISHPLYQGLGKNPEERQSAYRALFKQRIGGQALRALREATNKAWVLGNDRFQARVAALLDRQVAPKPRGGDRKSEAYRKAKGIIDRV